MPPWVGSRIVSPETEWPIPFHLRESPGSECGFLRLSLPIETSAVAQFKSLRTAFLLNKLGDGEVSGAGLYAGLWTGESMILRKCLYSFDIFPARADTPSAKSITHVIYNNHISKLVIQLAPQLVPQGNTNSG